MCLLAIYYIYISLKKCIMNPLPISELHCLCVVELDEFFIYSGYKFFLSRYMICKRIYFKLSSIEVYFT